MDNKVSNFIQRTITAFIFVIVFFGALLFMPKNFFSFVLAAICLLCLVELYTLFPYKKIYYWLMIPFYPVLSFSMMIALNNNNRFALFLLLTSVFIFDTGAYLVGSLIGRHKIWPAVSPNKSWQGFIGGVVLLTLFFNIIACINGNVVPGEQLIACAFVIAILATLGDFVESYLKRKAGVKDSGNLLPGHGGFLDRFDAIIFVTPLFFLLNPFLLQLF